MTLLDAYALVALVADEPAAEEVQAILYRGDARVVVVNLAETVDVAIRVYGATAPLVRSALDSLLLSKVLSIAVSDEQHAWLAGELRSRHVDRRAWALSLPDCFLLAHALSEGSPVATADPAVARVARSEGVELVPLPDPAGRRP